ncbi:MAG: sugar-binding protein [Polyangia bacterium]
MKRAVAALLFLCAGCRFSLHALDGVDGGDLPDLAAAVDDLAVADPPDLAAAADLTVVVQDLIVDPCGTAPALGTGNIAAQCVIGNPPTVDGNLADWPLAQFLPMTKTSSAQANGTWDTAVANDTNSSARFFVRWDLTYLYVAVSITDDVRNTPNTGTSSLSNNDAIEIFVDGQHQRATSYGSDDWQLVYSADTQTVAAQGVVVAWPAGTHEAWGGTSPAWTLEAAIPWSILGATGSIGRVVGFDLKLDDNDAGSMRDRDLILYYNAPNGGMCTAPNCRTDAFGAVQLQGR